jgi:transaldolase
MKFFLDTANVREIEQAVEMGVLDGVTTNPTLLAKEGRDPVQVLKEICKIVDGPVNAEVISTDSEGMITEAPLGGVERQYRREDPHDPRGHEGRPRAL